MEAHTGAIRVPTGVADTAAPVAVSRCSANGCGRVAGVAAARTQSINASRSLPGSVPGSEHTHLLPPKAY